jgi:hypothetical protein
MVDRHLVKARHEFVVEELSDDELHEALMETQRSYCAMLGLDPETTTIQELWEAEPREAWKLRGEMGPPPQRRPAVPRPALPKPRPAPMKLNATNGSSTNGHADP